ncbi:alpha-L-fucosidase [Bacteroides uniformis]|nr:alpha-L-fucosidase [Bacteroides uniformis]
MYEEGGAAYKWHLEHYGHPSEFGFKDVINEWKAEKWNPERLVALFKKTGARYFFAMGNHHDNMDLWDSKYQSWNSVNMGPKRNVLGRMGESGPQKQTALRCQHSLLPCLDMV